MITNITKRLSGIHAAWHFWYTVVFGGESGLHKVGLGGIHPLTRRYVSSFMEIIYVSNAMAYFRGLARHIPVCFVSNDKSGSRFS
ncbi:TPA: DUF3265 domain-containing protein [Vibrio vulnificus]|nr:DUF3265 domain-containing protein [Vibrio vulnificus]HAS6055679.1 DUF3265 domain-containing protein [Vibrio vulnificus]